MTADVGTVRTTVPLTETSTANLADVLDRILDKGLVIAGDIKVDLLDIELLTIRLRLFIASADTAKQAGIDWWETDPTLSSAAVREELAVENRRLRARIHALEAGATSSPHHEEAAPAPGDEEATPAPRNDGPAPALRREEEPPGA